MVMTTRKLGVYFLFALLLGVGPRLALCQSEPISSPAYVVGEAWVFKRASGSEYTKTVSAVGADGSYVLSHSTFPGVSLRMDSNLTVQEVLGDLPFDKRSLIGWRHVEFPMTFGKKFSYRVVGSRGWFKIESTASADWVTVQVPAGTFKAIEIQSCWTNESSRWYGCGMKHWYVPTLKEFVKRKTPSDWAQALRDTDFELVSASVKP